jgi:hypothetical protein
MHEIIAMAFLITWAVCLAAGLSFGGLIHVLLVCAIPPLGMHLRSASRWKANSQMTPAAILTHLVGRPRPRRDSGQGTAPPEAR